MSDQVQRDTLKQWLSEHAGLVLKVVRSFAAHPEDREDLFQEIAVQLWSSIPSFRGDACATTWIYRVSLNTALTWQRGERRRLRRSERLLDPDGVVDPGASDPDSPTRQARLAWIYEQLRGLPPVDRALMLLHLDGVSYREMAGILGISESNVGARLSRIRSRLAQAAKGE